MKLILSTIVLLFSISTFSKDEVELNYPELMVTPKASERITLEAMKEHKERWHKVHLPMLSSAMMTVIAGGVQLSYYDRRDDPHKKSALVGLVVGGSWLILDTYMAKFYEAYQSSYEDNKKLPERTVREKLIKERLAEEEINRLSSLATRMKWLSAVTNVAAGGYMVENARKDSIAKVTGALAIATALAPVVFPNRWNDVAKEQSNYKKKIFAPIVHSTIFSDPKSNSAVPGIMLSMLF